MAAFVREGDVFLRDLRTGALTQVTSTTAEEADAAFMADSRLLKFRAGTDWFVYDRAQRVVRQAAVLRLEKDPLGAPDPDSLRDLQLRLFTQLQRERAEKRAEALAAREARRLDPTRVGPTVYLGDEVQIVSTDLSLFKNVGLPRSHRIQIRIEAFNLFNQTRFNSPSAAIGTANFGRITSSADGRVIQFGVKYLF